MDFFARQQQVRRLSTRLVLLFIVAVVGIVVSVDLAVAFAFNSWGQSAADLGVLVLVSSVATLAAIVLAATGRMASLRGGGPVVAQGLGGVLVPPDTTDPQLRRLRNVVEEMAIASGVPVPQVYLLPDEAGINAFAAGWSTSDAAVAVTRGALERLNRDELQGVIAHEFSHVVNGDMRLNIRLIGLLFGILFLTIIGRIMLRFGFFSGGGRGRGGGREGGGNPLPLIGLALVAAGFIGVLAGRVIKAAVSRQREYLADASAVQYTRQTSGIAGALKKIAGLEAGSRMRNPRTEEVGHMLFGAGLRLSSIFATHPPLPDRIKALDPSFDPAELAELSRRWAQTPPSGMVEDAALGLAGPAEARAAETLPDAGSAMPVDSAGVVAQVAAPTDDAYHRAESILAQIPDEFLAQARRPDAVVPLLLGLLLSEQPEVRTAQHAALSHHYGAELADGAWREADAQAGLHPLLRLPLAEIAFPALRQRPPSQLQGVLGAVSTLIHADGRISVFEYCLSRLMHDHLSGAMPSKFHWREDRQRLTTHQAAVAMLLTVLAQAGHSNPAAAARAYQAGIARLLPGYDVPFAPPARGVLELDPVWPALKALDPREKARLVRSAVDVVSHDGEMTVTELELLRTICSLLHCPLPPLTAPAVV